MSGDLFDVLVLAVVLAYAAVGARRGLLLTLASTVGFVAGAAAGLALLPGLLADHVPQDHAALRPVLLVVFVLFAATLGQALCTRIALRAGRGVRASGWRRPDAALGAVLTAALALATVWFAAGLMRVASPQVLGPAVAQSRVLAAVDRVMPGPSDRLVGRAVVALDRYGFPRVFDGMTAEPLTEVPAPSVQAATPAVRRASASVLRVDALAFGCGESHEGTGWVAARGLVVTNAHVVAGAQRITVREGSTPRVGTVVAFDPERDLAVVSVPDLTAAPLTLGGAARSGDTVAVPGYPLGGPLSVSPARVRDEIAARGDDIYGTKSVLRQVYSLRVDLRPGNSGGPVLDPAGRVIGVAFGRSLDHPQTGYALTLEELHPVLDRVAGSRVPVGTGRCVA